MAERSVEMAPRPDEEREREQHAEAQPARAPQPQPAVQPGSLEWASAVGNQAVQQLARQHADTTEEEVPAEAPAEEAVEAPEPEEALDPAAVQGLAEIDDEAETLPE